MSLNVCNLNILLNCLETFVYIRLTNKQLNLINNRKPNYLIVIWSTKNKRGLIFASLLIILSYVEKPIIIKQFLSFFIKITLKVLILFKNKDNTFLIRKIG